MAQISWGRARTKAAAAAAVSSAGIAGGYYYFTSWQSSEDENSSNNNESSSSSSSSSRLLTAAIHHPYLNHHHYHHQNKSDGSSIAAAATTNHHHHNVVVDIFPTAFPTEAMWWIPPNPVAGIVSTTTRCDSNNNKPVDPGYPDLSRFGKHSYLKKYLTPEIYSALKHKKTSNNVTLEDLIQSGVSLPWGARPVRGCGIYAGDAESYRVFDKLLDPIVEDWHHLRSDSLRFRSKKSVRPRPPPGGNRKKGVHISRQATNLNPGYILRQNLDPDGAYILQTRMRVARSIKGFPFSPKISREQRRKLEQLIQDCTKDFDELDADDLKGMYTRVMDMTNEQHDDWIHRHILFHDPDALSLNAGLGRDWPDARGIYMNHSKLHQQQPDAAAAAAKNVSPEFMIWVNAEDHLRIISMSRGGDLLAVFTQLSKAIRALEASLKKRGYGYAADPRLGFLNTSPENLGTALRASVFVKLPRLGREPGFDELLDRLRLESSTRFRGEYKNEKYTGIFDIANSERLGQSEVQLINTMINGVGRLIALEKRLEKGEKVDLENIR